MSRPDATAAAALDADVIKPVFYGFLNFALHPVRANTSGETVTISGSSVPDLNGTYDGIGAGLIDIGEIKQSEGGNDSVEITLSALIDLDNDMLNEIGNPANWQGRLVRLWRLIRDASNTAQGGYQHYYTGYMSSIDITASSGLQIIKLTVEGYLSAYSRASGRTYLDQEKYDSGDLSARAAIPSANGVSGNPLINNTGTPGSGGGGGSSTGGGGGKYYGNFLDTLN